MSMAVRLMAPLFLMAALVPWWWTGRASRLHAVAAEPQPSAESEGDDIGPVDVVVVLGLLDAAITSGAGLPRALAAVGRAVGGDDGTGLVRASSALAMGASWEAAWSVVPGRLAPVGRALSATWSSGAAPGPALQGAAQHLLRERRTASREAAGRLGVRLVLPLGMCFLPAFVLIGLVPVMVSVGAELIR